MQIDGHGGAGDVATPVVGLHFHLVVEYGPAVFAVAFVTDHQRNGDAAALIVPQLHDLRDGVDAQVSGEYDVERHLIGIKAGELREGVCAVPLVGGVPRRTRPGYIVNRFDGAVRHREYDIAQTADHSHNQNPPNTIPSPLNIGRYRQRTRSFTFGIQ